VKGRGHGRGCGSRRATTAASHTGPPADYPMNRHKDPSVTLLKESVPPDNSMCYIVIIATGPL